MDIYMTGWGPDYFDAFNMIDPLVNPSSAANAAQVNITEINDYLLLASAETDPLLRLELYKTLQYLIHDKYYVNMPLEYENLYVVHAATLKGFPYNINRDLYWYPTYEE
jgi:ABC-type oligopeptide transport system substrate-binding subunit